MLDSLIALKDLDGVQGLPPLKEIEDMRYLKNTRKSTRAEIECEAEEVANAECSEVSYCGLSDVSSYNVGCLWFVCKAFSCRWHRALVLSYDRNSCIRLSVCFKSVAGKKGYIKCLLDVFYRWEHLRAVCPLELGIWQQGMMAALSASSVKKSFNFDCKSRSYLVYTSIDVQVEACIEKLADILLFSTLQPMADCRCRSLQIFYPPSPTFFSVTTAVLSIIKQQQQQYKTTASS
ncbi:hypothetical protein LOK49_Contig139G00008 [Camellia lanceoleosa]|nr:hypothetical protein LOK49_Contig139G00008 [Camellia lanceoleosa]